MSTETDEEQPRELDVRNVDSPFGAIVGALETLPEDETLVLINSFEPEPLYDVLETRGYTHETTQVADDEFRVEIEERTRSGE